MCVDNVSLFYPATATIYLLKLSNLHSLFILLQASAASLEKLTRSAKMSWRNKYAIIKDLSELSQGFVQIDDRNFLTTAERPPAYAVDEEIEDEFLRQFSGDANFETPDFETIQQMISMMKDADADDETDTLKDNDEEKENHGLVITKLNPNVPEFIPQLNKEKTEEPLEKNITTDEEKKDIKTMRVKKKERNFLLSTFLNAGVSPTNCENEKPKIKLLKPEDFITESPESIKANLSEDSLVGESGSSSPIVNLPEFVNVPNLPLMNDKSPTISPIPATQDKTRKKPNIKEGPVLIVSSSMFRKSTPKTGPILKASPIKKTEPLLKASPLTDKSPSNSSTPEKANKIPTIERPVLEVSSTSMFRKRCSPKPETVSSPEPKFSSKSTYVPSKLSLELYKKFAEESKIREKMEEDIWMQAEKKMKELDKLKQEELELHVEIPVEPDRMQYFIENYNKVFPEKIILTHHRHLLSSHCQVCKSLCVNTFYNDNPCKVSLEDDTKSDVKVSKNDDINIVSDSKSLDIGDNNCDNIINGESIDDGDNITSAINN